MQKFKHPLSETFHLIVPPMRHLFLANSGQPPSPICSILCVSPGNRKIEIGVFE